VDEGGQSRKARAENGEPAVRARRRLPLRRIVFLAAAVIGLYIVWPSLVNVLSQAPQLRAISWVWFVVMGLLEAASFACYWGMMRLTLAEPRWFVVATTQMAGNAFSRIVPGGAASGGSAQYQMLVTAGASPARTLTGLTATGLFSTGVLFALPVLSVPAILYGVPVQHNLARAAEFGAFLFVLILAAGAILLLTKRPLELVGRVVQTVLNRLRRHHQPRTDVPERLLEERDLIRSVLGDKWWQALGFAAGNWLFDFLALLAALAATGTKPPHVSLVLLAYVVAALLGMVPLTPGGLGFVEVGLVTTLGLAGIATRDATVATLAYRLVAFWLPMPVGLLAFAAFRRRFGSSTKGRPSSLASGA